MPLHAILTAFENHDVLPIDLNRVSQWIIEQGIQDEIEFIGVDLDIGIIRGYLHRFRYSKVVYGEPQCVANIFYGVGQGEDWINMVVAKELIHCMDGNVAVKKKDQLDLLLKRLALPATLTNILEDPDYANLDRLGDAFAAALLLPQACRDLLMEPYLADQLTVAEIAKMAVMPVRYVRLVMDERWPDLYARMKAL